MRIRRPGLVAAVLIGIAVLRIASTFTTFSFTTDEPVHVGAGLELLQHRTYTLQLGNPPLPRIAFAAAPTIAGVRWADSRDRRGSIRSAFYSGNRHSAILALSRLGSLLFFVLAAGALFWWAFQEAGGPPAVAAVLLFTAEPVILGYSGIANHDVPGTAGLAVVLVAFSRWLRRPDAMRARIAGAAWGFSILCKFSAIPYVPAACAAIFAVRVLRDRRLRDRRAISTLLIMPAMAAVVVWAGYGFTIGTMAGAADRDSPIDPRGWPGWDIPLPAPAFLRGLFDVVDYDQGHFLSYAFGKVSMEGWWWYFPVALLLKTTVPLLLLIAAGAWFTRKEAGLRWTYIESVAAALAILAISTRSTLDLGVRYVLPMYVPLALAGGATAVALLKSARPALRRAAIVLLASQAVVSVASHPDYFPYFNVLAGREPARCLVDSNLDWGQDALRLRDEVRRRKITRLGLLLPGSVEYDAIGFPPNYRLDGFSPQRGWLAVGEHFYRTERVGGAWRWLEPYRFDRIGTSIRLYYLAPEAASHPSGPREVARKPDVDARR